VGVETDRETWVRSERKPLERGFGWDDVLDVDVVSGFDYGHNFNGHGLCHLATADLRLSDVSLNVRDW